MNLLAFFFIILYLKRDTEEKNVLDIHCYKFVPILDLVNFEHVLYWTSMSKKSECAKWYFSNKLVVKLNFIPRVSALW